MSFPGKSAGGLRADSVLIALVLLAGLALLVYAATNRQTALRKSPVGFAGLQVWLNAEGLRTHSFTGGWMIDPTPFGLNILPLHDTRLTARRSRPKDADALLLQQDEYDVSLTSVHARIDVLPTLVILPKWRSGVRLTGLAHPVLLDDEATLQRLTRQLIRDPKAGFTRLRVPFAEFDYQTDTGPLAAGLYVPQVFASEKCEPVIGFPEVMLMLLGRCRIHDKETGKTSEFYLLSDPDLFNNHGLRLADNARIAADFIGANAGGAQVLVDTSRSNWFRNGTTGEEDDYERSWADMKRIFEPPFRALWLGVAALFALTLWRAGLRYGPLIGEARGGARGESLPGSARREAIRARARLMRLTGQDGALVAEYALARRAALGARLFGPAHGMDARALDRQIAAAFPDHAAALSDALARLRALPPGTSAADAMAHVNALETILERFRP